MSTYLVMAVRVANAATVTDDGEPDLDALGALVNEVGRRLCEGHASGSIIDLNGNSVGRFEIRDDGQFPLPVGGR